MELTFDPTRERSVTFEVVLFDDLDPEPLEYFNGFVSTEQRGVVIGQPLQPLVEIADRDSELAWQHVGSGESTTLTRIPCHRRYTRPLIPHTYGIVRMHQTMLRMTHTAHVTLCALITAASVHAQGLWLHGWPPLTTL